MVRTSTQRGRIWSSFSPDHWGAGAKSNALRRWRRGARRRESAPLVSCESWTQTITSGMSGHVLLPASKLVFGWPRMLLCADNLRGRPRTRVVGAWGYLRAPVVSVRLRPAGSRGTGRLGPRLRYQSVSWPGICGRSRICAMNIINMMGRTSANSTMRALLATGQWILRRSEPESNHAYPTWYEFIPWGRPIVLMLSLHVTLRVPSSLPTATTTLGSASDSVDPHPAETFSRRGVSGK